MGNLPGINVEVSEIVYEDYIYVATDEEPQVGDIVRVTDPKSDKESYYLVEEIDDEGAEGYALMTLSNDDDVFRLYKRHLFELYKSRVFTPILPVDDEGRE